tara:strand:+ start:9505 stop:9930 length:426 start_codon:yes stop_codon:yes gene_type:complete
MLIHEVNWDFDQIILGEPASAKNQRRIVRVGGKPRLIKSAKALAYCKSFAKQSVPLDKLLEGDLAILIDVFYGSRRPDLAAMDLIMDLLQDVAYSNDRQVKASQSLWNLDRENPRARIRIRRMDFDSSTGVSSFQPCEIWG